MATIDDFGGTTDPLNQPALGGPSGWAAAVRDYLKDKVLNLTGGTLTGPLVLDGANNAPVNIYGDQYSGADVVRIGEGSSGTTGSLSRVMVNHPIGEYHAATKGYVDGKVTQRVHGGIATWNGSGDGTFTLDVTAWCGMTGVGAIAITAWGDSWPIIGSVVNATPSAFAMSLRRYDGSPLAGTSVSLSVIVFGV